MNLVKGLSHKNREIERALNTVGVLQELIEIDSTFDLFFANDCAVIGQIIELAIDPTNNMNQ